jgi:hypothetical protein
MSPCQGSSVRPIFFRSYDEVFRSYDEVFRSYDEVFRSTPCDLFFLDRTMRF